MGIWDMLIPRYITPIVGLWYSPFCVAILILSFPLFSFLIVVTIVGMFYFIPWCFSLIRGELVKWLKPQATVKEGGKDFRRFMLLLGRMFSRVPEEEPLAFFPWIRKKAALASVPKALFLLGINAVYIYYHWRLTTNPAVLAQGDPQGLSATDFEWVTWFLGGFAGTGAALMIFNLGIALSWPTDRLVVPTKPERCLILNPCHESDSGQHLELTPKSARKGVIGSNGKVECLELQEPDTGHLLTVRWDNRRGWEVVQGTPESDTHVYVSQAKSGITCKRLEADKPMRLEHGDIIWWRVQSRDGIAHHSFEAKLIL